MYALVAIAAALRARGSSQSTPMFTEYSRVYDLIYRDKDYPGECDFLEQLFTRFGPKPTRSLLDVAAGTGSHALLLAQRGYQVTALDLSPEMAAIAERKLAAHGAPLPLSIRGGISMTSLPPLDRRFDAVLCLFSSIGYLTEDGQVEAFLDSAKGQLADDGILVIDFWNGITCLRDYSPVRVKSGADDTLSVTRISETTLSPMDGVAEVRFRFLMNVSGSHREHAEVHRVRYFFPRELTETCRRAGFEVLAVLPFKDASRAAHDGDWNITVVARRARP
ncbi:MAG: methyltransferase domain-containing protein [Deltaproteobacteria bacterium]|nr:methyltransferase domain-containing protein [Deltaproteobacteria bacterium]